MVIETRVKVLDPDQFSNLAVVSLFLLQQEQEGKKFVEPRSEDEQFEEVQQLPQVEHNTHAYENEHLRLHVCRETKKTVLGLIDYNLFFFLCQGQIG